MISEEEKERIESALECNNCLCWHKYCNAECCKLIFINIPPDKLDKKGKYLNIKKVISSDDQWYYKLHGVKYAHGLLRFPREYLVEDSGSIYYLRPCDYLNKENKCIGYPDNRPQMCKDYSEHSLSKKDKYDMTPNCLFKYKKMISEINNVK